MATSVKAKVDVSVSPYISIDSENDQPSITSSIVSSAFPSTYFGGGTYTSTIDNDNNVTITSSGVVTASSTDGSTLTASAITSIARQGVLILRHSGYTSAAKTTASHSGSVIRISTTNAVDDTTTIIDLSANDVFAIPYTAKNFSTYFAVNENTVASKPSYLEVTTIDNGE
jgi:hypothetical protein